jgi:hypothetical protein
LRPEAVAESVRLAQARSFTIGPPRSGANNAEQLLGLLETDGGWLSFTRASGTFPRGRILLILRAAYEDPAGRLIESTVVPVEIACGPRPRLGDRRLVDQVVKSAMERVRHLDVGHRCRGALTTWSETAMAFTRAFFETRLTRERAIAAAVRFPLPGTFQPGLFDRRAERQHLAGQISDADANTEVSRRVIALENAARAQARPAQLLLVLAS